MTTQPIPKDTSDFLTALLFAYPADDDGANPYEHHTPEDFSDAFIYAVTQFIDGFREYLDARDVEIPDTPRSFGGNVYFSLSGHGVGFWDSSDTEHLQAHLVAYAGDRLRFEEIDLWPDDNDKLDLSILPEFIDKHRDKLFSV